MGYLVKGLSWDRGSRGLHVRLEQHETGYWGTLGSPLLVTSHKQGPLGSVSGKTWGGSSHAPHSRLLAQFPQLFLGFRSWRQHPSWSPSAMPKLSGTTTPAASGSLWRSFWKGKWDSGGAPKGCGISWNSPLEPAPASRHLPSTLPLDCPVELTVLPHPRGVISGAITSQYLLEKSRIVFQVGCALPGPCMLGWSWCGECVCVVTHRAWQVWVNVELMSKSMCMCEDMTECPPFPHALWPHWLIPVPGAYQVWSCLRAFATTIPSTWSIPALDTSWPRSSLKCHPLREASPFKNAAPQPHTETPHLLSCFVSLQLTYFMS